ncbi:MAG TPA: glycosyltransferase 87 family protein [Gaiellaceae bacterium]|nr:glycosyltransferase 87 family protein [Gaiellaceae bacterium]
MSTRSASWSRPAERTGLALLVALAVCVFAAAWAALHLDLYSHYQIRDTPVYRYYGESILHGDVPYRDFDVEYPPASLPAFVLPALGSPSGHAYRTRFDLLMLFCGFGMLAAMAAALAALGADALRAGTALAFAAVAPLALGSVMLSRYDLWPAALAAAALAALCAGRHRLSLAVLGLAVAAKIYPAVLAPLFVVHVWRRRGPREAAVAAGLGVAVLAAIYAPFAVLSPSGVWHSVVEQTTRPLQIESLGSAVLLAAHHLFGLGLTVETSHGSQNLAGSLPDAVGAAEIALLFGGLAALWLWFARRPRDTETLVRASAAAVCLFVAFGKVLSPQYMIWLLPLVPLVRGLSGLLAGAILGATLVLTQLWFPDQYWDLVFTFGGYESALVLARDLVLLALLAVLVWPAGQASTRTA